MSEPVFHCRHCGTVPADLVERGVCPYCGAAVHFRRKPNTDRRPRDDRGTLDESPKQPQRVPYAHFR